VNSLWTLLRAEWDRVLGIFLILAGAVALFFGYQGVADSLFVGQQLAYVVSGGLGGLFLATVGVGLLVSADLHDEWRKLDRIEGAILAGDRADAAEAVPQPVRAAVPAPVMEGRPAVAGPMAFDAGPEPVAAPVSVAGGGVVASLRGTFNTGLGLVALAAVVMAWSWDRTAAAGEIRTGAPWLVAAAVALAVGLLGVAAYPVRLRISLAVRKRMLLGRWWRTPEPSVAPEASRTGGRVGYVIGEGQSRLHLPGCPTLRGLKTSPAGEDSTARPPCRICQPQ
jgi:hypothetical protein